MVIVWLALIGAVIVTGILVITRVVLTRAARPASAALGRWAAGIFVGNLVLDLLILYFAMPALTGPYFGWQWLLWPLLLTGVVVVFGGGALAGRGLAEMLANGPARGGFGGPRYRRTVNAGGAGDPAQTGVVAAGVFAIAFTLLVAFVANGIIVVSTTWFDPNAKALAHIPHITVENKSTPLPPTDVNHIVLVTQGVASFLGQQVLGSTGQNLGSTYHTEATSYTLQSVNHHLYWIAPLVYNNVFANLGHMESPGYVEVDAEDPTVQPTLHTGFHMLYIPNAILNQDLLRHVYLSGFTYGNLVDPTLEVRDDGRPFFTISLMQPTRGFIGDVVTQVLLVDPQTGAIQVYAPSAVPSWVDRVIPATTVNDYLTWWGQYINAPWFNPAGSGQQVPATSTPELVYNNVDNPVWLEPMTSSAGTDNSSTGVILFDTHDDNGRFYPLTGLGVTSNVITTFKSNPKNLKNYDVGTVQLYQIYGIPTWVATFVQQNDTGESFAGVGLVDARHLISADVIMETNKADALAAYAQSLSGSNGVGPTSSGNQVQVKGTVTRISAASQNGTTVYYILIQGQNHIFEASLALSPELPLVREGDTIQASYIDTGQTVVTLGHVADLNIQLTAPNGTATPGS
ncbi:MAG TPA: hypothetical protein VGN32_16420 [Ktedonobacterales bacterium]|nr:hypothetical protein [Ktedonobacterales bacterium]